VEDDFMRGSENADAVAPGISGSAAKNDVRRKIYEAPELVKIDAAKKLLRGPTYVPCYYDSGGGFSNYDQGMGSRC